MVAILAALMLAAAPQHDTIFTADGGRIVGTVVEESPQTVAVQLVDGTFRRLPRREVVRIEYADGSVTHRPSEPAPSPPAAASPPAAPPSYPPPPPAYAPPPPPAYPPPYYGRPVQRAPQPAWGETHGGGPISPLWGSLGIGGMFFGGDVSPGVSVGDIYGPQMNLALEGGLRLNPHLGLGLYLDMGVGGTGSQTRAYCNDNMMDCSSETVRFGLLLRHTFAPAAHVTPWIAVGTGYAYAHVAAQDNGVTVAQDVVTYTGWEMARLMVGVDVRSNQVLGVGFYAGLGFTRYDHAENAAGTLALGGQSTNTMVEAGVRLTLFP